MANPTEMQKTIEVLKDEVERGIITADEANVQLVLAERVRIIKGKMPADVRRPLNDAVKQGRLAHVKRDGHMPEAYYHPGFEHLANSERQRIARATIEATRRVFAPAGGGTNG